MANVDAPRGRNQFAKLKPVFNILVSICKIFPLKFRVKQLEKRRNTGGRLGIGLRYVLLKAISNNIGDNVAVFQGVYILNPQNISIGNNVSIQPMCYLEGGHNADGIVIDDDVSIAHGVTIMSTTHTYDDSVVKIKDQPVISEPVHIKENVWIGAKATILSGVSIESGCVIGANAVVTKNTEPNGVYVGAPAREIKSR